MFSNIIPDALAAFISLVIFVLIMKKLLFKPVTNVLEQRRANIDKDREEAKLMMKNATDMQNSYEGKLKGAKNDADRIRAQAKSQAQKEAGAIVRRAKMEADQMKMSARIDIEAERDHMIMDIKEEVVDVALSAATKVMKENMNVDKNKEIVREFIDKSGVA